MEERSRTYSMKLSFEDKSFWNTKRLLEHRAETHSDRPFLQYELDKPLSYNEVNQLVNRVAHGLASLGVGKGDKVLIWLPNCLEYIYTWLGANKLGAVEVPVNTAYKGYFLEHLANNSRSRVMIVDQEFLERVKFSEDNLQHLERLVVWGRKGIRENKLIPFKKLQVSFFDSLYDNPSHNPETEVNYADIGAIMFTSGTTGPSKGVLMPQASLYIFSDEVVSLLRMTDSDVFFTCHPFFHANAQLMTIFPCLVVGAKVVAYERFSAGNWIDQIRDSQATLANFLGVMMDFVFRQPERPDDGDNNLRAICAVPCPPSIYEAFKTRFRVERILEVYGMTEIDLVTMMPYDDYRPGSCGKVVDNLFELRIADSATDEELSPDRMGEMLVRPKIPWIMNVGYNEMPDKTAEAFRNCWYHSGDGLKVDEDGYFYFVDRVKDALRRRAENISSFEVEKVIIDHPAVAECAVVAVKSEYRGGEDEVKACVVLKPGAALTPEEIMEWSEERMPYFAVPRYIEFISAIPKTPTEKVRKGELRSHGVTLTTWDREKAGYKLKEELEKLKRKKES